MQFMEAVFRGREQFFFSMKYFILLCINVSKTSALRICMTFATFFFSLGKQIEFGKFEIVEMDKLIISARKLQPWRQLNYYVVIENDFAVH